MATQDEKRGLDKVTDYHEEKEMNKQHVQQALARLQTAERKDEEERRAREKALSRVKVAAADVELVKSETGWDVDRAERLLREHGGSAVEALKAFVTPAAEAAAAPPLP